MLPRSWAGFHHGIEIFLERGRRGVTLRARARITSHVWVLRHLSGKARGLRILLYGKDEQRRQTGWIDAQTWEVILARALKPELKKKEQKVRVQYFQDRSVFGLGRKGMQSEPAPKPAVLSICIFCFGIFQNGGIRHSMGFCYTVFLLRR